MTDFPAAVPQIPVSDMTAALEYYRTRLGFRVDWGGEEGGLAGISRGLCRLFLATGSGSIVIRLNLDSVAAVDALHEEWRASGANIIAPPEAKPWGLHEFAAADTDGNLLRVFYDFATPQRG